ncbi:MAG: hypothetical protein JW863_15055 [Chitinispirillaceae bacterium]|nr:hypothetical protein [Chitinispirillaceae bacterium]
MAATVLDHFHDHNANVTDSSKLHRLLVAGHTDTAGGLDYNRELSQNRAKVVLSLLTGDDETFGEICHQVTRWMKVADYKQILTWLSEKRGWNCNPGTIDNSHDTQTQNAVNRFKQLYNSEGPGASWAPRIEPEWGDPNTKDTWKAYFHCYEEYIANELGTDISGLAEYRSMLHFASANEWVGCNEYHPRTLPGIDGLTEQSNRRVEVLMFAPGNIPDSIDCCPDRNNCSKEVCVLYGPKYTPVPYNPGSTVTSPEVLNIYVEISDESGICSPDTCTNIFRLHSSDPALTYDRTLTTANGVVDGIYIKLTYKEVDPSLNYSMEITFPTGGSYYPFEDIPFSELEEA